MTRLQFRVLNVTGAILILSLVGHFLLSAWNARLGSQLRNTQTYINNSSQVAAVLDQLAKRIALGSETEPRLRDLLIKYGLTVTLDVQGKKKSYP